MTRVGFVGTGRMGAPMVRRLVASGHTVRALGRNAEKRSAVSELGAQPVAGLREIAEVMTDREPLREGKDLGFGRTGPAEQLVDLAGPIDGLAVPAPNDFDEHAE